METERSSFIDQVEMGLAQLKNGETVTHEEIKKLFLLDKIKSAKLLSEAGKTYSTEEAKELLLRWMKSDETNI